MKKKEWCRIERNVMQWYISEGKCREEIYYVLKYDESYWYECD